MKLILHASCAVSVTAVFILCNASDAAARPVDTPYGTVEGVDLGKYEYEESAERSAEEYDGQEAGAGVVTDLVFSLTEENLKKKKVLTTFKHMYVHYCGPCHGEKGNGEGHNFASVLEPWPADHTDADYMATLSDEYICTVIGGGTASVGKSNLCPPWGQTFSGDKIKGLAVYVRSLSQIYAERPEEVNAVEEGKVTLNGDSKVVSCTIIWGILGLVSAFVVAGALHEWGIFHRKRKDKS